MGSDAASSDLERLLADSAWLERLAHRLARPGDAEDAVQDTWLTVLRHPPDTTRPARPWLATVLRHLLQRQGRERRRRQSREQEAAVLSPTDVAPASAGLERLELQRLLTALVLELEEPFRSTVVQRYLEGRSGAQIARAAGIPEGTVRWRLNEGLKRLRLRLDQQQGASWRALVLGGGKAAVMKVSSKVGLAVLVVLLLALGVTGPRIIRMFAEHSDIPAPPVKRPGVLPVVAPGESSEQPGSHAASPRRAPPPRFAPAPTAAGPQPSASTGPPPARPGAAIPLDRRRDFTADELAKLAANCEVRVDVPGLYTVNEVPMEWMDDRRLSAAGLHAIELPVVRGALDDYRDGLNQAVRRWHGAVAGDPDVARSVDFLDYTTGDHPAVQAMSVLISAHQISEGARRMALELAGRAPSEPPADARIKETASLYRGQLQLARRFESTLAAALGPARARVLLDGPLVGRTRRAGCVAP